MSIKLLQGRRKSRLSVGSLHYLDVVSIWIVKMELEVNGKVWNAKSGCDILGERVAISSE